MNAETAGTSPEPRKREWGKALLLSALIVAFLAIWMLATHAYMRHHWGQVIDLTQGQSANPSAPAGGQRSTTAPVNP